MDDSAPSRKLEKLIAALKLPTANHIVHFATKLIDTLGLACESPEGGIYHLVQFLTECADVDWSVVKFDLHANLKAQESNGVTNRQYLQALGVFLNVVAEAPEFATEETFDEILASVATPDVPDTAPEIFQPQMLTRIFDSKIVTDDDLRHIDARFVLYRHTYATGKVSHQLRGLAFTNGTRRLFIILESGEFVVVPEDYEHIASLLVADKHVMPATLTAYLYCMARSLAAHGVISDAVRDHIMLGGLGKLKNEQSFASNCHTPEIGVAAALQFAIDNPISAGHTGPTGATGPHGGSLNFFVGDQTRMISVSATPTPNGAQIHATVSAVTDARESVLMRLDYPRSFSVRGIYLFPLSDGPTALIVL